MKATHIFTGIFFFCMLFITSCTRDELDQPQKPQAHQVTFSLQMPRSYATAAATGLTEEQERMISDLTILLFTDTSSGDMLCEYMLENLTPTPVGTSNRIYTVTAPLPVGNYRMMLLANVPAGSLSPSTTVGGLLSSLEKSIRYQMPSKWDISTHTGFPMWGMSAGNIIITGPYTHPDPILMLRMLSRINLSVDDIKISTIRLHNPSSRGLVIPDEAHLDRTTTPGYIRVTAPTLPLNSAGNPDPGLLSTPWEYTATEIEEGNYCLNTIYALEGFDPQGRNDNEYAWLEVLCSYKGGPEEAHRIDFVRTLADGTRAPIGLLRNHSYEIRILSMSGDAHLEFEVVDWNDSDMSDIIFEGKYYLKVNQSKFELDRQPHDANGFSNKLTIETNYEDGWVIDRITEPGINGIPLDMDNGWIRIDPTERSGPKDQTTISILLDENNTGASRSAEIHLRVGRLIDFIVTVTQQMERKVELYIEDLDGNPLEELIFYDFYGNDQPYEQKAFRVRWAPYGTDDQGVPFTCQVRTTLVGDDYFDYKAGTERITTGTLTDATGRKEYIIEPEPFTEEEVSELLGNPFLQHASWVTFTVTDPADASKTVSKTIFLNHQHIAIISRNFRRLSYLDRTYTFDVLANTPFILERVDNKEDAFASHTPQGFTGGNNIVTGTRLTYTTQQATPGTYMDGVGRAGRKATFYLRDQRGLIRQPVPFTVSAITDDPNTYIVNPPASGIHTLHIPIRKLFWIREREAGDTTIDDVIRNNLPLEPATLSAECYHPTDLANPLQNYQVHLSIDREPGGANALEDVLKVEIPIPAGGLTGNIIVGVKRPGASTWLWTWHIWITDFNPDLKTSDRLETEDAYFMKRNLGALTDAALLNPTTTGFYYQWGRKDPLHPDHIPNNRQAVPPGTISNLLNSIDHPAAFYTSTSGLGDWYTSMNREPYQNNFLWNDYEDHKTPYDPCPAGWRVPFFIRIVKIRVPPIPYGDKQPIYQLSEIRVPISFWDFAVKGERTTRLHPTLCLPLQAVIMNITE
ncbi:MAG: hypothetical protein LIP08_04435 [Bacteroides sp.]|nr:hypothetical protein [Bacteroides sp.]